MRRKLLTLLAALAVLSVAAGGVSAAGIAEPVELFPADEDSAGDISPAEEDSESDALNPEDDGDDEAEAGICVVGADSPCNGDDVDGSDSEQIGNDSEAEKRILIPEDQNGDGKIDERFRGNDSDGEGEVGVCMIGVDSPCNGDDVDGSNGVEIGEDTEDPRILLPEDQDGDGKIDERFRGDGEEASPPTPGVDEEKTSPPTPGVDEEMVSIMTFSTPLIDILHIF